jgi:hypothetical protein
VFRLGATARCAGKGGGSELRHAYGLQSAST